MPSPKASRPEAHVREDQSRTRVRGAFEAAGWTVEDLQHDYGEDQLVRIFIDGEPSGLAFFVQVKSVGSLRRYRSRDGRTISYPFSVKKLRQWSRASLPVILVLWDAETDAVLWSVHDPDDYLGSDGQRTRQVRFGANSVLCVKAISSIEGVARDRALAHTRERDAARNLLELWSESLGGAEIEYDPQGVIYRAGFNGGDGEMYFFGEMVSMLEELCATTGLPLEDAVRDAIHEKHALDKVAVDIDRLEAATSTIPDAVDGPDRRAWVDARRQAELLRGRLNAIKSS